MFAIGSSFASVVYVGTSEGAANLVFSAKWAKQSWWFFFEAKLRLIAFDCYAFYQKLSFCVLFSSFYY